MDIFEWVQQQTAELYELGRDDIAEALWAIPTWCNKGEGARAREAAPAVLAAADELDRPWIGVFIRHWLAQERIVIGGAGASALTEAVDNFERATRPETIDCPQSACTTQDLSICYSKVDGIGWANERLAVVEETIARIDPSWSCWECMAIERSSALQDLGRVDEAIDTLERVASERLAVGKSTSSHHMNGTAARMNRLSEPTRALELLDENPELDDSESSLDADQLVRISAMLQLGRTNELSTGVAPNGTPFEQLVRHEENGPLWSEVANTLISEGLLENTAFVGIQLREVVERAQRFGAFRNAWDSALLYVELAAKREARWVCARGVELAKNAQAQLRYPDSVADTMVELEALANSVEPTSLPVDANALSEFLNDNTDADIERMMDWLDSALTENPNDTELVQRWAQLGMFLGGLDAVVDDVMLRLATSPEQVDLSMTTLGLLGNAQADLSRFDELAAILDPTNPLIAAWVRANGAFIHSDYQGCLDHCDDILQADDDVTNTRRLAANAAHRLGKTQRSVELMREVCDRCEVGSDEWTLMEFASIAGDWETVRWAANRLDMPVELGTTPINELWGLIVVRPTGGDESGRDDLLAVRTGPVTAEIRTVNAPGPARQRTRDVVVFDASPINNTSPLDADSDAEDSSDFEAGNEELRIFAEIETISEGGWRAWTVYGERPTNDQWEAFIEALREQGYELQTQTPDDAQLSYRDDTFVGVYAFVAAPETVDPSDLAATLGEKSAGWNERLVWPQLLDDADADEVETNRHWDFWNDSWFVDLSE